MNLANLSPGADTIVLPTGVFKITIPGTNEDANQKGDFDILDNLTIKPASGAQPVIDGNGMDRVFDIPSGHDKFSVEFDGLIIRGGNVNDEGGGIDADGSGIALTLVDTTVTGNQATSSGGGIDNTSWRHSLPRRRQQCRR